MRFTTSGSLEGRIAVITPQEIRGRDTIDAHGLIVAPGFIDIHTHGQTPETYRFYSLDGVTTALELELGTSDVDAWYRERSAGELINYGVSIGHIKVRMSVMHDAGTFMPVGDGALSRWVARTGWRDRQAHRDRSQPRCCRQSALDFHIRQRQTRDELLAVFNIAARTTTPVHLHITPGVDGLKRSACARHRNRPLHCTSCTSIVHPLAELPVMLEMIPRCPGSRTRRHDGDISVCRRDD